MTKARSLFPNALPAERLGQEHASLESFRQAVHDLNNSNDDGNSHNIQRKQKEYSLVVVTDPIEKRILLGKKHRGFGVGFFNSFGGKIEPGETDAESAYRELEEETGISLPCSSAEFDMVQHKVGTMHFTFQDSSTEMVVHVFRITVSCNSDHNNNNSNDETDDSSSSGLILPLDPTVIRGCDEITPIWYDDWYDIPLHNMFADDSIWLTRLLSHGDIRTTCNTATATTHTQTDRLAMDGWFHFAAGGQEENRILHYHLNVRTSSGIRNSSGGGGGGGASSNGTKQHPAAPKNETTENNSSTTSSCSNKVDSSTLPTAVSSSSSSSSSPPFTLEKRLFHALHDNQVHSPSIKEFKESWVFCNAVRSFLGSSFDLVIDVAGGHGALAVLFLILTSAQRAVVIDPAQVGGGGVFRAWSDFCDNSIQTLDYRYECLRTALPAELNTAIFDKGIAPHRILVVACHACQHLSDEVLAIACGSFGVHAAVMPCCQKDTSPGLSWKSVSKKLNIPISIVMDILLAGKALSWSMDYDVRMKTLDQSITPQNRLIACRAAMEGNPRMLRTTGGYVRSRAAAVDKAHERLERAYRRAHHRNIRPKDDKADNKSSTRVAATISGVHDLFAQACKQKQQLSMLFTGFCLGLLVAQTFVTRPERNRY